MSLKYEPSSEPLHISAKGGDDSEFDLALLKEVPIQNTTGVPKR